MVFVLVYIISVAAYFILSAIAMMLFKPSFTFIFSFYISSFIIAALIPLIRKLVKGRKVQDTVRESVRKEQPFYEKAKDYLIEEQAIKMGRELSRGIRLVETKTQTVPVFHLMGRDRDAELFFIIGMPTAEPESISFAVIEEPLDKQGLSDFFASIARGEREMKTRRRIVRKSEYGEPEEQEYIEIEPLQSGEEQSEKQGI